ncbi:MAG: hypothetical protein ACLS3M_07610 [Collinsella sp.]
MAQTLTAVCYGDNGLGLPTNACRAEIETSHTALDMLSAHIEVKRCLTERGDDGGVLQQLKTSKAYDCELDIAGIVMRAIVCWWSSLTGRLREPTSATTR